MATLDDFISVLQGASNSAASTLSAPVDAINWALGKVGVPVSKKPVGGSEWLREIGFTAEPKNRNAGLLGEAIGGVLPMVAAAKAPQIATGLNQAGRNIAAPRTLNPQAGAVYGGKWGEVLDKKYGDKLDAYLMDGGDRVTLSKLVVPKEARGEGVGSAFMDDLTALADKEGKTLALSPSPDFGGSVKRLDKFYRRFGFVPNKGRFKDYEVSESMLRPPGYAVPTPNPNTKTFSGDVEFFDAVGVNRANVRADVDHLYRKHPEFFKDAKDAADHVAHGLLGKPVLVAPASDSKLTLTVQNADNFPLPGGEDKYRALTTDFASRNNYTVRSGQGMSADQLLVKKQKAKK